MLGLLSQDLSKAEKHEGGEEFRRIGKFIFEARNLNCSKAEDIEALEYLRTTYQC